MCVDSSTQNVSCVSFVCSCRILHKWERMYSWKTNFVLATFCGAYLLVKLAGGAFSINFIRYYIPCSYLEAPRQHESLQRKIRHTQVLALISRQQSLGFSSWWMCVLSFRTCTITCITHEIRSIKPSCHIRHILATRICVNMELHFCMRMYIRMQLRSYFHI